MTIWNITKQKIENIIGKTRGKNRRFMPFLSISIKIEMDFTKSNKYNTTE